jgi:hypothetical protein
VRLEPLALFCHLIIVVKIHCASKNMNISVFHLIVSPSLCSHHNQAASRQWSFNVHRLSFDKEHSQSCYERLSNSI